MKIISVTDLKFKLSDLPCVTFECAIFNNYVNDVFKWIEFGIDVNRSLKTYTSSSYIDSPLELATSRKHSTVLHILLSNGADFNPSIASKLIFIAIDNDDIETIKVLIKFGANIHVKDDFDCTPLQRAVECGNTDIIKILVNNGANINQLNKWNNSLLKEPIQHGKLFIIKSLIDLGAHVNIGCLEEAYRHYQYEIVSLLQAHGVRGFSSYDSDLSISSDSDDEYSFQKKSKIKTIDLHRLIKSGDTDLTSLIAQTPDLNVANKSGETFLSTAIKYGRVRIVKQLCVAGADVNARANSYREKPLFLAIERGRVEIVRILLEHGANPRVSADKDRLSPAQYAKVYKQTSIQLLIDQALDASKPFSLSSQYLFNFHRHVKIWLSKDQNIFLSSANQIRLVKMRALCPSDEIYFIYDSKLLTNESCLLLEQFCFMHGIIFKDIRTNVFPLCLDNPLENKLISIYEDEVSNLSEGGNVAAASDILRWLSPVYTLGVYSDFDVIVNTQAIEKTICVGGDLLINISSDLDDETGNISYKYCNDIIAVINPDSPNITTIQEEIIKSNQRCERKPITSIPGLTTKLPDMNLSPREYRKYICDMQKELESIILDRLAKKHNISERINLLDYFLVKLENITSSYRDSVVSATGPAPLWRGVNSSDNSLPKEERFKQIAPLSLSSYYDVFCAFASGQGGALHTNHMAQEKIRDRKKHCDLSWTTSGSQLMQHHEMIFNKNVIKIQAITRGFFTRNHLKQIRKLQAVGEEVLCSSLPISLKLPLTI